MTKLILSVIRDNVTGAISPVIATKNEAEAKRHMSQFCANESLRKADYDLYQLGVLEHNGDESDISKAQLSISETMLYHLCNGANI